MTSIDDIFYIFAKYQDGDIMAELQFREDIDPREAFRVTRGEIKIVRPADLVVLEQGPLNDKIHTGHPHLFVFSQRFFDVIAEAGLTGWSSYPVSVAGIPGGEEKQYAGLVINGRVEHTNFDLCRREARPSLYKNNPPKEVLVGPHFDLSAWDGTDIFIADPMFICVTRRFKEMVEEIGDFFRFEPVATFTQDID